MSFSFTIAVSISRIAAGRQPAKVVKTKDAKFHEPLPMWCERTAAAICVSHSLVMVKMSLVTATGRVSV